MRYFIFLLLVSLFLIGCEGSRKYYHIESHYQFILNEDGTISTTSTFDRETDLKVDGTIQTERTPNIEGQLDFPLVGGTP